jgi:hypothetical protein
MNRVLRRICLAVGVLLLALSAPFVWAAEPAHDGYAPIAWTLYPGTSVPKPTSRSIVIAVHENRCASGRNPIPYLQRPEVSFRRKAVLITLWIEVGEGFATCQGNPVGRLKVSLPKPLGDRRLYDGSSNPPRKVKPGEDPERLRG